MNLVILFIEMIKMTIVERHQLREVCTILFTKPVFLVAIQAWQTYILELRREPLVLLGELGDEDALLPLGLPLGPLGVVEGLPQLLDVRLELRDP